METPLVIRPLKLEDYRSVYSLIDQVSFQVGGAWNAKKYSVILRTFPEGQLSATLNGQIVGVIFSQILPTKILNDQHTYADVTANGYICHHDTKGDLLYGFEVAVLPRYQRCGVGRKLYLARQELCQRYHLRKIVLGARMPGYKRHAVSMNAIEYIRKVESKQINDPVISFQLAMGFGFQKLLHHYLPYDAESCGHAAWMEWANPSFQIN